VKNKVFDSLKQKQRASSPVLLFSCSPPTPLHSTPSFLLFATSCRRRSRKSRGFSFCRFLSSTHFNLAPLYTEPIHPNFVSSSRSSWIMDVKIRVTQQPFWKSRVALTDIWTLLVMNKSKQHYNHWYTEKNFVFLCIRGLLNDSVPSSKYRQEWQTKWTGEKKLHSTFRAL